MTARFIEASVDVERDVDVSKVDGDGDRDSTHGIVVEECFPPRRMLSPNLQ